MTSPFGQTQYQVRFDWGLEGASAIGDGADVIVVVDVLSFGTSVDIATTLGTAIVPSDTGVDHGAEVTATGRSGAGKFTNSPASFSSEALAGVDSVVLPSPNGSAISAALAEHGAAIVAASLRNRRAIAQWALAQQGGKGDRFTVAVVAAGERREDGSTRFAVEDLLGAGAVIDALADVGIDYCSPEAAAASAAFTGLRNATGHLIGASASGRELAEGGYRGDIDLAIDLDCSVTVPVLGESGFRAAP